MSQMTREDWSAVAAGFDLTKLGEDFYDNPFPYYAALRRECPVKRLGDGSCFLTRYGDVQATYKDPQAFSSDKRQDFTRKFGPSPLFDHYVNLFVFKDPPAHTRVRRLITAALNPKAVEKLLPGLAETIERLLDALPDNPEPDLIDRFASAVPVEVIGNILGVPRSERGPLRQWSQALVRPIDPVASPQVVDEGNAAVREFLDYLGVLVAARRRNLGDPEEDILSRLIVGEGQDALTPEEVLHNCIFLLNAGHETTTNLIGNALVLLAAHPETRDELAREPDAMTTAVEEVLRLESPNQFGNRVATRDVEVGGVAVPAGTRIVVCIGGANRDPDEFADPDRFDIRRKPNRHLAFATGIHQCSGMSLARIEGTMALSRFLRRYPAFTLAGKPVRNPRAHFRGFASIPCHLEGHS